MVRFKKQNKPLSWIHVLICRQKQVFLALIISPFKTALSNVLLQNITRLQQSELVKETCIIYI